VWQRGLVCHVTHTMLHATMLHATTLCTTTLRTTILHASHTLASHVTQDITKLEANVAATKGAKVLLQHALKPNRISVQPPNFFSVPTPCPQGCAGAGAGGV